MPRAPLASRFPLLRLLGFSGLRGVELVVEGIVLRLHVLFHLLEHANRLGHRVAWQTAVGPYPRTGVIEKGGMTLNTKSAVDDG